MAIIAACGGEKKPAEPAHDAAAAAPARGTPELLAGVPADAAFVLAMREPLPAPAWERLAWDLGPFARRMAAVAEARLADAGVVDPVERLGAALIAELPGPIGPGTRAVAHELGGVAVLRLEVEDEAALAAAVASAFDRAGHPGPVVEGGDRALAVVRTGRQVAIAEGPVTEIRAVAAILAGDRPLPGPAIDPAAVPPLGGHFDLGRLAREIQPGDDASPACRDATVEVLGLLAPVLPRLALRGTVTAERAELVATAELDPAIAAAVAAPPPVTPGIPATFPGRPIVGVSFAAPGGVTDDMLSALWTGPLLRLAAACGTGVDTDALPTGGAVRGGALAVYDANTDSLFPTDLQAYATVLARDPAALFADLRGAVPGVFRKPPPDTGRLIAVPGKDLEPFVSSAYVARKGDAIVLAAGKTGRAHAETALAATEPPPILHLFLDIARLAAPDPEQEARGAAGAGISSEAGLGDALARLVDTLDVALGGDLRIVLVLAPPAAEPAPSEPNPGRVAGAACHRLVDRMWSAAAPNLQRLGVARLSAVETSYRKWSFSFVSACVDLDPAARACLLGGADPLDAAHRCLTDRVEPPSILDPFEPDPLEERLHPTAGAPTLAELAGTWKATDGDETWRIAASGKATEKTSWGTERHTLEVRGKGHVRFKGPDGGYSTGTVVVVGPDEILLSSHGRAFAMADEASFAVAIHLTGFVDAWVFRDARGCALVTEHGLSTPADCVFTDRAGGRYLDITYHLPCGTGADTCSSTAHFQVIAGHLVPDEVAGLRFRRAR